MPRHFQDGPNGSVARRVLPRRATDPRHRRTRETVLALLAVLVGIALIAYPYVSDYLNVVEQSKVQTRQQDAVTSASPEDLSTEREQAEDFDERIRTSCIHVTDPFDPDSGSPSDEEYESVLNLVGDGVMGQLVIPSIGVNLPIYHGVDGDGMNHGVGHMPSTSLPIGGDSTHCVLAGHTGLPSARIFDRLTELKVGDWFVIRILGEDHAYRVTSTEVVLPDQTDDLAIQDGKDLVTLVTCTPYGINTQRLLVHAERCDVPQEWLDMQGNSGTSSSVSTTEDLSTVQLTLVGIGLGALVALLVLLVLRRRRDGRD